MLVNFVPRKTKEPHAACLRWFFISSHGRCGASVGADALLYMLWGMDQNALTDPMGLVLNDCVSILLSRVGFDGSGFAFE